MILVGRIKSFLASRLLPREFKIIYAHQQAFAPGSSQVSGSKVLLHLWRVLSETVLRSRPAVEIDQSTRALVDSLRGTPVLALTGHLGNWEYLARFGTRDGFKLSVIARPARIKLVQRILENVRGDLNVIWRSGPTLKAAAEVLKDGLWLGALIDQDLDARGERVPGFGLRAHTPSSLVSLALKSNAAILAAFMIRKPHGGYLLIVKNLSKHREVDAVLEGFQVAMREVVSEYPSQWVWFHKRWRTTKSERISGKKYCAYLASLLPLGDPFVIVRPRSHSTANGLCSTFSLRADGVAAPQEGRGTIATG